MAWIERFEYAPPCIGNATVVATGPGDRADKARVLLEQCLPGGTYMRWYLQVLHADVWAPETPPETYVLTFAERDSLEREAAERYVTVREVRELHERQARERAEAEANMLKRQTADAVEEAEREAAVHEVLEHLAEEATLRAVSRDSPRRHARPSDEELDADVGAASTSPSDFARQPGMEPAATDDAPQQLRRDHGTHVPTVAPASGTANPGADRRPGDAARRRRRVRFQ
jgi:hypothetical protein